MLRRWRTLGPALAVLVSVVATAALTRTKSAPDDDRPSLEPPTATAVTSDAPRYRSLPELVDVADVVVRARVVATERGRTFGDPGGASLQSRIVTLRVDAVLAGTAPPQGTLLVEEEGWLADGTPLVVDGAAASTAGDQGIWFLKEVGDPELPAYVVVNAEGRYLVDGDGLRGAEGDDPLIEELAALSAADLTDRIIALAR